MFANASCLVMEGVTPVPDNLIEIDPV